MTLNFFVILNLIARTLGNVVNCRSLFISNFVHKLKVKQTNCTIFYITILNMLKCEFIRDQYLTLLYELKINGF